MKKLLDMNRIEEFKTWLGNRVVRSKSDKEIIRWKPIKGGPVPILFGDGCNSAAIVDINNFLKEDFKEVTVDSAMVETNDKQPESQNSNKDIPFCDTEDGYWYFYDEVGSCKHGPFITKAVAEYEFESYCIYLDEENNDTGA